MLPLSFQLYSACNFLPLENVFKLLALHGYTQVEGFGGIYGALNATDNQKLKAQLDDHGLTMPTGHFSIEALEDDRENLLAFAKMMGMTSLYCPYLMPEQRPMNSQGWHDFGERLQEAGKPYQAAGFNYGWHNHDFEFIALPDGSLPIDHIFAGGPNLSWELDVAWVVRSGVDPFAFIEKYKDRITAVHVKDVAPSGENADEGGWADVGHGIVPWARLFPALTATKAQHFIVEHDNPSDLAHSVRRSIQSIRSY